MSTELTTATNKATQLRTFLSEPRVKEQIGMACSANIKPEKLIRTAMTLVQTTPALLECTQASILAGIVKAAELGIELTGALGQAYLIPYRSKAGTTANFQIGYRGLIELAYRSDRVLRFDARVVYSKDHFSISYSDNPCFNHQPSLGGDPGDIIGFYSSVFFKNNATDIEYMSLNQILEHRDKYSKAGGDSPWNTAFTEMAKKTVIRKLAKRLPLCTDLHSAIDEDERPFHNVGFSMAPNVDFPVENKASKQDDTARRSKTSLLKDTLNKAVGSQDLLEDTPESGEPT
jgi:recombination protein RecT